jgi:hypothetical protein
MDELKKMTEALEGAGEDTRTLASVMADVLAEVRKREAVKPAERGGPCWKVPPYVCPVKQTLNATVRMDGGDVVFPLGYVEADPDAGDLRLVVGALNIERTGKIGQSPRALLFDAMRELHLGLSTGFSSSDVSSVKLSNIESDLKRIRESLDTMGGHVQSVLEGVELTRDALDAILEASEEIEAGEDEGEE